MQDGRLATAEVDGAGFTVGVEEEFCVVDAGSGELRPVADEILPLAKEALGDQVEAELNRSQVETGTRVCATLAEIRAELIDAARWRAARYGVEGTLVDLSEGRTAPAGAVVEGLMAHLRPALEAAGDWDEVDALVRRTMACGNGAARQRAAFARRGEMADVLGLLLA